MISPGLPSICVCRAILLQDLVVAGLDRRLPHSLEQFLGGEGLDAEAALDLGRLVEALNVGGGINGSDIGEAGLQGLD